MAAYFIAELVEVTDPAGLARYRAEVTAIVARHGGRFLAAGTPETIEGDWTPKVLAIIAFESMERLQGWYNSEVYAPYRQLRQRSSASNVVFVEGL